MTSELPSGLELSGCLSGTYLRLCAHFAVKLCSWGGVFQMPIARPPASRAEKHQG